VENFIVMHRSDAESVNVTWRFIITNETQKTSDKNTEILHVTLFITRTAEWFQMVAKVVERK